MDNGEMGWVGGEYRSLKKITPEEVVEDWAERKGDLIFDLELCTEVPELVWVALLEISQRDLTGDQKALLAAGPLENLLSFHGEAFIDRVEERSRENVRFNDLLGGVWKFEMLPNVWERVQKARDKVW